MGWASIIGVSAVIVSQLANAAISKVLIGWEKRRRASTDKRLTITAQVVESIRHLRYYGWQDSWVHDIMDQRQKELGLRVITSVWNILISFNSSLANGLFPVLAFFAYTSWAGQELTVDVAFPALQLFAMLENNLRDLPGLVAVFINANVAMARIESFMREPDKEDVSLADLRAAHDGLELAAASFAWPGHTQPVLREVSVTFKKGLNVIFGRVGAGKSALLQALLGELDLLGGHASYSKSSIAYCGQVPWLESMSIRDNILFAADFNAERYYQTLEACALNVDLAGFEHGDLSNIGENGVGLSGGQKARVALARAIYSDSRILLLDDPISALDHQTAEHVVHYGLQGSLMDGRTVILVTHRVNLCAEIADQLLELEDGALSVKPTSKPSTAPPAANEGNSDHDGLTKPPPVDLREEEVAGQVSPPEAFLETEHKATGDVKAHVYWQYIKAGSYSWWSALIVVLIIFRLVDISKTWLLKQWGEAYKETSTSSLLDSVLHLPPPQENVKPWLVCFAAIILFQSGMYLISRATMLVIVYGAGKRMFEDVIQRITHATFRFYDVTPVGRLMNRLTGDINTVDGNISEQFQQIAFLLIAWGGSVAVIATITPVFFVFALGMTVCFMLTFRRFLPASQMLRRLEVPLPHWAVFSELMRFKRWCHSVLL